MQNTEKERLGISQIMLNEYTKHISKVCRRISKNKLDALLISSPSNITYLSGFRKAEGFLLITKHKELIYFTSPLYSQEARENIFFNTVVDKGNIYKNIVKKISHMRLKRVGFESKHLHFREVENLKSSNVNFIPTEDILEKFRAIKSPREISFIRRAIAITGELFSFIKETYEDTYTEKTLFIEIERFLKLKGDIELAFPPIVASGRNTALPHYLPRNITIGTNFFLIDAGAKYNNYCADLTRIFFWDKIPPLLKKIIAVVKKAQEKAIATIKDGVSVSCVDAAARKYIESKGWGKYFIHGLGHGLGIDVHEYPYLISTAKDILKEGMVITVEPAVYITSKFGVRIEDVVLVKKEKGEVLSGNIHRGD